METNIHNFLIQPFPIDSMTDWASNGDRFTVSIPYLQFLPQNKYTK